MRIILKLGLLLFFALLRIDAFSESDIAVYEYLDKNNEVSVERIIRNFDQINFSKVDPYNINHSYNNKASLWILMKIGETSPMHYVTIENAHLDYISTYFIQENQVSDSIITGDLLPFKNRKSETHYFSFQVPDKATAVILKIKTDGLLTVPIRFFSQDEFVPYLLKQNSMTLFYYGVAIVIIVLNLLLYWRLKEKLYLYYLLSVISFCAVVGVNEGYFFKWLWPDIPSINQYNVIWYALTVFLFLFSEKFLNIKKNSGNLYRIFQFFYFIYPILILLNVIGFYQYAITIVGYITLIGPLLFIFSGIYIYSKTRDRSIIYYIIGWGFYSIMVLFYSMAIFDFIEPTFYNMYAVQIGGIFEMIVIFLAIVHKIEVLKKEKDSANQKIIDLLIAQEESLHNQNKLLEDKVFSRTMKLRIQKEKIEIQNSELKMQREELSIKNNILEETLEQLKTTQFQLVQSEKMAVLGQLTAGIGHELNNPINYIKSGLEGLRAGINRLMEVIKLYDQYDKTYTAEQIAEIKRVKEKTQFQETLHLISRIPDHVSIGVNRATELVKELRSFARKDKKMEITDLHKSLESSLILLHNQYKEDIQIVKKYGDIPEVNCYPGKLNQVFINILSNAIDAIHTKKNNHAAAEEESYCIKISTYLFEKNKYQYIAIEIEDNGVGISEKDQKAIFDPFNTSKPAGKGLGLGLFISENIIKDHSGFIELNSQINQGTVFKIVLPVQLIKS